MFSSPIAVFAYSRPNHLSRTLLSLVRCHGFDPSLVTVFVDGPKSSNESAIVENVANVATAILGPQANIRCSSANQGLSKAITSGVSSILSQFDRVIVIEDDLELSPLFLTFMNQALELYKLEESVMQISGYMFDVPEFECKSEALFLPFTSTWGWATWRRAWKFYDSESKGWEEMHSNRRLRHQFNLEGSYPYYLMMRRQMAGLIDSWGIRWYWSVFRKGGLVLFPPLSLVRNSGQDGSGTHGKGLVADFSSVDQSFSSSLPVCPWCVRVSSSDYYVVRSAIWKQNGGLLGSIFSFCRLLLGR